MGSLVRMLSRYDAAGGYTFLSRRRALKGASCKLPMVMDIASVAGGYWQGVLRRRCWVSAVCAEGLKWNPRPLLRPLGAMPPRRPLSPEVSGVELRSSLADIFVVVVRVIRNVVLKFVCLL